MIATIARTTIMPANRTRFAVMALDLALDLASDLAMDLLGFGFVVRAFVLEEWGRQHGLRPEWIQPEKRRKVAHYDVFGAPAAALIARLKP